MLCCVIRVKSSLHHESCGPRVLISSRLSILFVQVSRRQSNLTVMMLSALRGQGIIELQRELSAMDPNPTDKDATSNGADSISPSSTATGPIVRV